MTQTCLSARPSFCTRPISARKDSWTIGCQDRILSHFSSSPELCTLKLNPFITTPHSLSFLLLLPNLPLRAVFFPSIHTEIYLLTLQLPGQNEKLFFPLLGILLWHKTSSSWKQPIPKCRNLSRCVWNPPRMNKELLLIWKGHTHKVTVGMCYQAEMLLKIQGWITEIKLKLGRDIRKDRKDLLKCKINKRKVEKSVGPQIGGHRKFRDKREWRYWVVFIYF